LLFTSPATDPRDSNCDASREARRQTVPIDARELKLFVYNRERFRAHIKNDRGNAVSGDADFSNAIRVGLPGFD